MRGVYALNDYEAMLKDWVEDQVHAAAEAIGYDLEGIPQAERWMVLFDYSSDKLYTEPGVMGDAWRAMRAALPWRTTRWIEEASEQWSL